MDILLLILGLGIVLAGAEILVEGASSIAHRFGLSEFLIGMLIIGIGTSTPEMVVSFIASVKGISDVAIGNIVGSNIANTFLILGITSIIVPIRLSENNLKRDIPMCFLVCLLLFIFCNDKTLRLSGENVLNRTEGALLLLCFIFFILYSVRANKVSSLTLSQEDNNIPANNKKLPLWRAVSYVVIGLAGLIGGGHILIKHGMLLAKASGMSDAFIGITIMALGTSLPELAASIVAAAKNKGQMVLGNIVGSNTVNILLILGGSALIHPLTLKGVTLIDMLVLLSTMLVLFLSSFSFKRKIIDRFDGIIFLLIYIAYIAWLAYNL